MQRGSSDGGVSGAMSGEVNGKVNGELTGRGWRTLRETTEVVAGRRSPWEIHSARY